MPLIENNMHFFAIAEPLSEIQARRLLNWVIYNPCYTVHLWIDPAYFEFTIGSVQRIAPTKPNVVSVYTELAKDGYECTIAIVQSNASTPLTLHINSMFTIPAMWGSNSIFRQVMAGRDFAAAVNVLRLWAIHHFGGIYFGWTMFPERYPQIVNLNAKHGVLFSIPNIYGPRLDNNVLAAPKGAPSIVEMEFILQKMFMDPYARHIPSLLEEAETLHRVEPASHEDSLSGLLVITEFLKNRCREFNIQLSKNILPPPSFVSASSIPQPLQPPSEPPQQNTDDEQLLGAVAMPRIPIVRTTHREPRTTNLSSIPEGDELELDLPPAFDSHDVETTIIGYSFDHASGLRCINLNAVPNPRRYVD